VFFLCVLVAFVVYFGCSSAALRLSAVKKSSLEESYVIPVVKIFSPFLASYYIFLILTI
jgi:hypothetical protein